jgi:hypothetical protein
VQQALTTVSIFVPDDHPWMKLKQALDWPKINAVLIKHWQNVDGDRALPWPTEFYLPLLVSVWFKELRAADDRMSDL